MWNNTKDMPENYKFQVTSLYEFDKNIGGYMSSEGEPVAILTVGRFMLYLDLVGEASFTYRRKVFKQRDQLDETLLQLIQEESPEIKWRQKPELRLYLMVGDDAYSGFELDITYEKLPNKLALEVMMARMLVDSIEIIEREEIVSTDGVEGIAHLMTGEEKRFLNILGNYKQLTAVLPWKIQPDDAIETVYNRIMEMDGLMNAVSMINVVVQGVENENHVEITTAWSSDNHAVDNDMRYISGQW